MVVLFGGSFNPPTVAHKSIIEILSRNFDKVIIVPNGNIYQRKNLVDFCHRKNMLEILTKDLNNILISDIEQTRIFKGTIETLRDLNHPVFACGDDCLKDLHTWIDVETLLDENDFAILTRNMSKDEIVKFINQDNFLNKYQNKFQIFEVNYPNVSSSDYKKNKTDAYLTKEILEYIEENGLYKED